MAADEGERKLAVILSADAVGYARLMEDDERATVRTLTEYRAVLHDHIERHKGRVVDNPGDNLLAEFASPVEAVEAAAEIQSSLAHRNGQLTDDRRMDFRIGINLGDVIAQDGALFGDGVNIAARLESLAEAGGICLSGTVFDQVKSKIAYDLDYFGEQAVKNISEPVRAYRVVLESGGASAARTPAPAREWKRPAIAAAGLLAVLAISLVVWQRTDVSPRAVSTDPVVADDPVFALPAGPSIAVLPFENLSGDTQQDYFVEGLTEDIIAALSRFQALFLIGSDSTRVYKGQSVSADQIGRELGVRFVVTGSVRRAAETIRITAQLLDAADGAVLWSKGYDRKLSTGNIFAIQDEITETVVATIAGSWGEIDQAKVADSRGAEPDDVSAYECVQRAKQFYISWTLDDFVVARNCLEVAVETHPDYADAWAWLGALVQEEHGDGYAPKPNPLDRGREYAKRAQALAPDSQMAQLVIAEDHFFRREWDKFDQAAERTLELNPNNSGALGAIGFYLAYAGHWDRAIPTLDKALALSPHHADWIWLPYVRHHYRAGRYEDALAAVNKIDIQLPERFFMRVAIYGQLGRIDDARAAIKDMLKVVPDFQALAQDYLMDIWAYSDDEVAEWIDGLRKGGLNLSDDPPSPTN